MKSPLRFLILMLLVVGCVAPGPDAQVSAGPAEDAFLNELAQDTWAYLSSDWATENHLPWSWRSSTLTGGDYANPAEIGFQALSWLAAYDAQAAWSPTWGQVEAETGAILDQLRAWQTGSQAQQPNGPNAYQHSLFYQAYWIAASPPVVGAGTYDHIVPSIDNAWLAASLVVIREYAEAENHPSLTQKADAILADMDFTLWYHYDTHRFSWGDVEDPQGGVQADYYSNENRIINFVTRALGQISAQEFQLSLGALEKPSGSYDSITVRWTSWDGSYFTYAGPSLFIKEMSTSYGRQSILPAAQAQIAYAADQGYAAWGLSDCFDLGDGGYILQGAPPAQTADPLEQAPGVVTAHASALALITPQSAAAVANLQTLAALSTCSYDSSYGFRDAVMADLASAQAGQCSSRFSALAQQWIFLSLADHRSGFLWDYFYRDPAVAAVHFEMYPPIFSDVPASYWSFAWIERLYDAGVTGGCSTSPLMYCPDGNVTRAQMAVFLERGIHGSAFKPPDAVPAFGDIAGHWAEDWIEALRADGITGGCGAGMYCPESAVTRAQMAVFLLRSEHGAAYKPPDATGTLFTDVPASHWAAAWIEQLAREAITGGCGSGMYCPEASVTRAQMAVFLVRTFGFP